LNITKTIPVAPAHFLLGNMRQIKQDTLGFMSSAFTTHGSIVKIFIGRTPVYLISDPELVSQVMVKNKDVFVKVYNMEKRRGLALVMGNGLVNSKGPLWQRQRRMMQPMFQRGHIASMADEVAAQGKIKIQELLKKSGSTLDMMVEMSDLTLNIIARTMFSNESENLHQLFEHDIEFLLGYAQSNFFHPLPVPQWIPTAKNKRFKASMQKITRAIEEMIQKRHESQRKEGDLLDVLLQARDEETGEAMETQQVVDECFTIFGAGHETTATALTWASYLISQHPDVERRLVAEVDEILKGRTPTIDDLDNLPYTRAVLEESMRFYPSVVSLLRRVERDIIIDDYSFQKNAYSIVNIYNIHHHPDYWQEPIKFRPERFLYGNKETIKRYSYLPFGIGERVCIGNHFAMMEAMILLTQLVQQFHFSYASNTPPQPKLAISLRPLGGMPMKLLARGRKHNSQPMNDRPLADALSE